MIKQEECMNRIKYHLSQIQAEVKLNVNDNRYNINKGMEDVSCSLLNLIYGWDLKNENHIRRNAKAVDLIDRKGRISVQVTYQNSRKKIQGTIKKFINHKRYREFDQLYIMLLTDKENYEKPFETNGLFPFDSKQHIMDFSDLVEKLRTLDIKTVEKVSLYLDDALKDAPIGHGHKRRVLSIALALAVAVLAVAAIAFVINTLFSPNTPTATVYLSRIMSYTKVGYLESYDDVSPVFQTEIDTDYAFSILSFVRSDESSGSRIEEVSCNILSLEPIEEPVLVLDAVIVGDTLRLFAFNNGWGTAETVHIDDASIGWYNDMGTLSQIVNDVRTSENADIAPASAVLLAEFDLDRIKFQNFLELHDSFSRYLEISISASGVNCSDMWGAYLSFVDDGFKLGYGGIGDGEVGDITLFAVLDVDKKPSVISFTGRESTPRVKDTLRVETVLAPTKSCVVTCWNEYLINGSVQRTYEYTSTVRVPAFRDLISTSCSLTEELAQLDTQDEVLFKQILQKYYYNPESIFEQYN